MKHDLSPLLLELDKAYDLFQRSNSPIDREYLLYVWRKIDLHLTTVSCESEHRLEQEQGEVEV